MSQTTPTNTQQLSPLKIGIALKGIACFGLLSISSGLLLYFWMLGSKYPHTSMGWYNIGALCFLGIISLIMYYEARMDAHADHTNELTELVNELVGRLASLESPGSRGQAPQAGSDGE